MSHIVSLLIWTGSTILTITLFFVVLILDIFTFPFDKNKKILHRQCYWWSDSVIFLNPFWKVHTQGLENIDHKRTYIIVANHQSLADIVVLYQTRMQFKWVAKDSLFKIPFVGWCLTLTKHIQLERGDYGSIRRVYRAAVEWLRKDMSVLFFPEGTRSQTDEMNEFQSGAFKLAIREKVPVLPIIIRGTREAIPKGGWVFKAKVAAEIIVLPAIETASMNSGDFAALRDNVRASLASGVGQS